jgi:hypothetical protein
MQEESIENQVKRKYKNLEDVHNTIVGRVMFETPKDVPDNFTFPLTMFGDMFNTLKIQEGLMLANPEWAKNQEWSQAVALLNPNHTLSNSKVVTYSYSKGVYADQLLDGLSEAGRWMRPFIGAERKPLTFWHIHPKRQLITLPDQDPFYAYGLVFGNNDIAHRLADSRRSIYYTIAAPEGIKIIVQTKAALTKYLPISMIKTGAYDIEPKLWPLYSNRHATPNENYLVSKWLDPYGYALLEWKKPLFYKSVTDAYYDGAFLNGVPATRIKERF